MFFKNKKSLWSSSVKKIDRLVTGIIVGWAVASMIWLSKTDKWKKVTKNVKVEWIKVAQKWYSIFWKVLVKTISLFSKK